MKKDLQPQKLFLTYFTLISMSIGEPIDLYMLYISKKFINQLKSRSPSELKTDYKFIGFNLKSYVSMIFACVSVSFSIGSFFLVLKLSVEDTYLAKVCFLSISARESFYQWRE